LVGKPEGKRPFGKHKHRWMLECILEIKDMKYGLHSMVQDKNQWHALVKMLMNVHIP
jgi:hypothetical protein